MRPKLNLVKNTGTSLRDSAGSQEQPSAQRADDAGVGPDAEADAASIGAELASIRPETFRTEYVARLFERHRGPLLQYLTRLLSSAEDAEEVLQETYIRLLKVEDLRDLDSQVRRFLFKIATNLARDRFRQRKARSHGMHLPYELVELVGDDPQPDELVDWDLGMRVIRQALLDLPTRHRQVFLLHVSEHLSYRSIARHLGVSTKTVERDMALVLELCQSRLRQSTGARPRVES